MKLANFDLRFLEQVSAIIGVDEAGRGPLAGPVCAASVYLDKVFYESAWASEYGAEINDSKRLKESVRERIFDAVCTAPKGLIHFACHFATVKDIELLNILGATRKAMAQCIDELKYRTTCNYSEAFDGEDPLTEVAVRQGWLFQKSTDSSIAHVLVDGKPLKPFPHPHTAIVKGDAKSLAIALASIIAKVTRDRYMHKQAEAYPEYGFISNKGYGTPRHIAALKSAGPCKLHRMSFLSQILSA